MLRFILGVAVGMAAGVAMERNRRSTGRASMAQGGRVDELTTAAEYFPADTGALNVGDGTRSQGSASGRDERAWPAAEELDLSLQETRSPTP
jgi:hypothetical protein